MTRSLGESFETLGFCADCKKCEEFCPVGIPTGDLLLKLKGFQGSSIPEKSISRLAASRNFSEKAVGLLSILQKFWQKRGRIRHLPFVWTKGKSIPLLKPQKRRPEPLGNGPKIYLFQGCLVKYFFPEVRESVIKSLVHLGYRVVVPPEQVCCGAPSLHLGDAQAVRSLVRKNLESFIREDPDIIMTVCPTGHSLLKKHYPRVDPRAARFSDRVQDYSGFLSLKGQLPQVKGHAGKEVYYHYPCHYLNELRPGDAPSKLLSALGFDLVRQKEPPSCCGFCGVFSARNPEISVHLWEKKKKEILESGASLVATDCPGCLFQLRAGLGTGAPTVRIYHTAEVFAEHLEQTSPSLQAESRPSRDCQGKDLKENQ
jgi:Fe-S oxidoreductase